jgi:hypothetical protein
MQPKTHLLDIVMTDRDSLIREVEALSADRGVQPLRLTITGKSIRLYAAPKAEERDDRVFPHMWVHHLRIRRDKGALRITKDTWDALPEAPDETIIQNWPAVRDWINLRPPVSFEVKQAMFAHSISYALHYWTDQAWSREKFKWEFDSWKSMRDAEHHDMILQKRNPTWVVNLPRSRPMGVVFCVSDADPGKARVVRIWLEVCSEIALYRLAPPQFKEQVAEEYARPYDADEQENRKEELRNSGLGFNVCLQGIDVRESFEPTYFHGPPLDQEEFRSTLQNYVESFRRSRRQQLTGDDSQARVAVHIHGDILETCLGGTFTF